MKNKYPLITFFYSNYLVFFNVNYKYPSFYTSVKIQNRSGVIPIADIDPGLF